MIIPVSPQTTVETNILLRALWAELRKEFGKLAWHFDPSRHGEKRTIYFGWADINLEKPARIGITYKKKGIATSILIEDIEGNESRLENCVQRAKSLWNQPPLFSYTSIVSVDPPLSFGARFTPNWKLQSSIPNPGRLQLSINRIHAFDDLDAQAEFSRRFHIVLDCLSFLTNAKFDQGNYYDSKEEFDQVHPEINQSPLKLNEDWLDGYPLMDNLLMLDSSATELLNIMSGNSMNEAALIIADAAHHYHCGRHIEILKEKQLGTTSIERAVVSYLSALEVASLIESPASVPCPKCNQPQYKISERVRDFVDKHLGIHAAKIIHDLYSRRSSYLHLGRLGSSRSYLGVTIPQLDHTQRDGILSQIPLAPVINLREFTSYCLRGAAREWCTQYRSLLE